MIIKILLIAAYIGSVFLARHLNRKLYEYDECHPRPWVLWLIPILNVLIISIVCLIQFGIKIPNRFHWLFNNRFTGKYWVGGDGDDDYY